MKLHEHIESLDFDKQLGDLELEDGGMVTGAVVLMKIEYPGGQTQLSTSYMSMSYLERIGALQYALAQEID